ncbi:MAG: hypothetical protein WAW37_01985 [Syntrophobacteraceae bacterium]
MRFIGANVQAVMEVPVDILAPMGVPEEAYVPHRGQYDAGFILKHLAGLSFPRHGCVLAVTTVDICTPILTYVFGQAELEGRLAIISNFRLKGDREGAPITADRYHERLVKVALHEIAHTFSVYHCEAPKCLMQISPRIQDLDGLDISFCERCKFILSRHLKNTRT